MADVFGDSSLFDEFDKVRPSVATFISYNQNEKGELDHSRIIFQCADSESDSESDWEQDADEKQAETGGKDEEPEEMDESDESVDEDDPNFNKKSSKRGNGAHEEVQIGALKHTNHQLQFEREKLRKFVRKIDSSRCFPDEESPVVQILYQNNDFSRKYRSQIESFINHLIFEHVNDQSNERLPELQLKATALTCVDLNEDLNSEQRTHDMWKNHAIIGTSHYYIDFQVDTTGWPLLNMNPSLTHSWEIPRYEQIFFDPLPVEVDHEGDTPKGNKPERKKAQCFNCGGDHMMHECKERRDPERIRINRQNFMQNSQSGGGPQKNSRYHADIDVRFSSFKPGVISDNLREALGLDDKSAPIYIYRMRLFGYPPGWLEEAKTKSASGVNMFDKHGRQVSITGETLEDGEFEEVASGDSEIDTSLIIEYPGFTVPFSRKMNDEHLKYEMPPLQPHQLKETLLSSQSTTKRKSDNPRSETVKKPRQHDASSEMELEDDGSFPDYYDLGNTKLEDTSCFIPPLPSNTPPSQPPLPNETPPSSGSDFKFSPRNPMSEQVKRKNPMCLPAPKSDAYLSSDSLEDLEARYTSLQKQLLSADDSNSQTEMERPIMTPEAGPSELDNPVVLSSDESSHPPSDTGSSSSAHTTLCQSVGKDYGTPVHHQKGSFNALPVRASFSLGIQDHIPFENLPQSTGTYDRMRKLFIKIKQTVSEKNSNTKS